MNRRRLHVVLLTTIRLHRSKGGAEKVMIDMANELVSRGHRVTIVCSDRQGSTPGFRLSDSVRILNCASVYVPIWYSGLISSLRAFSFNLDVRNYKKAILNLDACAWRFSEVLNNLNPDIYITFDPKLSAMLKKNIGVNKPIITSMQFDPDHIIKRYYFKAIKEWLPLSGVIHVLTPEYAEKVKTVIPNAKIKVIPNVVKIPAQKASLSAKLIVNVARVVPLKNQELLAKAFTLLSDKYPEWNVCIYGEKTIDSKYVNQINKILESKKIGHRFELAGPIENVQKKLLESSIFVFPSINEGQPLALMEAMAAGLPCVALKECAGSRHLIEHGVNGLLCENNPESLSQSIELLINDFNLMERLGKQANIDMFPYRSDLIWDEWEQLLYCN